MNSDNRQRLPFYKMHGGGNDFVLIDHRDRFIPEAEQPGLARRLCHRQVGVGADGLILIEAAAAAHFRWRFYNADGSEPEMCGNGGRCAARFAVIEGIAPETLSFETVSGIIHAEVRGRRVKLALTGVGDFRLNQTIPLEEANVTGHFVRVGVPHLVVPVDDLEAAPGDRVGPAAPLPPDVSARGHQRRFRPLHRAEASLHPHLRARGGRRNPGLRHRLGGRRPGGGLPGAVVFAGGGPDPGRGNSHRVLQPPIRGLAARSSWKATPWWFIRANSG